MNEEYFESAEKFLNDSVKISFEFPEYLVSKEKPELSMSFKDEKKKKESVIKEKTKNGRTRKSKSSLF